VIPLSIGLSDADRTRAVAEGRVRIAGVEAAPTVMPLQPLFNTQLTTHRFDCCEFPIATWLRQFNRGAPDYVGIPVFPSRHFRLSCVFVNRAKGIVRPAELAGRRIGTMVWDMAAAVWLRGILEEHYGLPARSPIYVNAGLNEPRLGEDHPQEYPDGYAIEHAGPERTLSAMLAEGEIDALYTARAPDSFFTHPDRVGRLFADPMAEELAYFRRSGIHPPMHLIAVKRAIAEAHPWLPRAVRRLRGEPAPRPGAAARQRDAVRHAALARPAHRGDGAAARARFLAPGLPRQPRHVRDADRLHARRGAAAARTRSRGAVPARPAGDLSMVTTEDRAQRLRESMAKIRPPFALDLSLCLYSPQENVEALEHPRVRDWFDFT